VFGRTWRIGTIRGIPVNLDSSWVWIAALVTYTLVGLFMRGPYYLSGGEAIVHALGAAALFFGSVFLHELAHAVAARVNGIEVFGITLVVFGGFTSARSDRKGPGTSFVISAVGPATSLALAGAFAAVSASVDGPLGLMFWYVGWVNGFMAVFNVLPGLPLDGGRMLEAIVWRITSNRERATRIAARAGVVVGLAVIGWGALRVARGDIGGGLWPILIGMFILQGARASEQQIGLRRRLAGATVGQAMGPPPPAIAADLPLAHALDRFATAGDREGFPVIEDGGRVIGVVTFESARPVGMRDPIRPVREATIPLSRLVVVREDDTLEEVAGRLASGGPALVLRDGRLVGELSARRFSHWLEATRG
jgi:Zn-dependent protease/CBS domain-containing protein